MSLKMAKRIGERESNDTTLHPAATTIHNVRMV
jgi:hypothetical protein